MCKPNTHHAITIPRNPKATGARVSYPAAI